MTAALRVSGALLAAALVSSPASAAEPTPAVLAAPCASCHGLDGHSPGAIPPLDGLDAQSITTMLHGYRDGTVEGTIMNRIAKGYSDAEIDALARYLAETH